MIRLALIFVGMSVAGCALIVPRPTVEPICNDYVYINKLETPIDTCRGVQPVVPVPFEKRGGSDSDRDSHKDSIKPEHKPEVIDKGNPGNDKQVGKAGEQDKDTGRSGGSRGASTGKV